MYYKNIAVVIVKFGNLSCKEQGTTIITKLKT